MPEYYPIYLNLENKKCTVIGGGEVGERKVLTLLQFGAKVSLISPELTQKLKELANSGEISYTNRRYQEGDLAGSFLVVAATDDRQLNERLAAEAEKYNILINIVDVPEFCNFIVPSIVKRGDLTISISTGGKSPALAKKIRKQLEGQFGNEYAEFLDLMGKWREAVIRKVSDIEKRKEIFEKMVESDLLELLKTKDKEKVQRRIDELMKELS